MQKLINFLSKYIATWFGFIGLSVVLGLCLKGFSWRTKQLMFSPENQLLDSRFWYTPNDVQSFFAYIDSNIGRAGLNLYALTQVTLDVIFPIAYGMLFTALITLLYRENLERKLLFIPALAATADIGENIITAILAWNYSDSSSSLAWIALVFTLTKWTMIFSSVVIIVIGIILFNKFQIFWKDYIFLLRIPIILGILLFLFPILGNTIASSLIQNLFVMRGFSQLVVVMVGVTMAALMVSFSFERIFDKAPKIKSFKIERPLDKIESPVRYLLVIVLVLSNWIPILLLSSSELKGHSLGAGLLVGFGLSFGLAFLIEKFGKSFGKWFKSKAEIIVFKSLQITPKFTKVSSDKQSWYEKFFSFLRAVIKKLIWNISKKDDEYFLVISLGIVGGTIYLLFFLLYQPGSNVVAKIGEAPALLYVYLLIWILTGILSTGTFYFDRFHVPFVVLLVLFSGFGYWIFQVDHFFKLEEIQSPQITLNQIQQEEQKNKKLVEIETALNNRLQKQSTENGRTLVVVAASGGGIQASGWTAQVLGGLQEELGSSFTQATGLISSVSGGSVGTMYFLDSFDDERGYPAKQNSDESEKYCLDDNSLKFNNNKALDNIFCNATEDWLDAVGWGAAYHDLIRLTGWLSPLVGEYNDRGYALEHDWQLKMRHPETTLSNWREKSIKGEIPIPVFNATFVEDGRRFLISPLKLIEGDIEDLAYSNKDTKVLDFQTLYKDKDLKVTTAARLSATFPYVSPLPRNKPDISYDLPKGEKFFGNYHVADGGYFDNSGLFTAVELLSNDLGYTDEKQTDEEQTQDKKQNSIIQDLNIKRILLLEINASPQSQLKGSKGGQGWFMESIGPLEAAYKVRDSTQISRNLKEVELLEKLEKNSDIDVDIESSTIYFPENEDYNQPLSWRLTEQQKKNLKLAWQCVKQTPDFQELKELWQNDWKIPLKWKK